jgi:hypothetical protein
MVSTYLSSKRIIDSLLANSQFVNLAKILVNSDKGSTIYLATYIGLDNLLTSLGITVILTITKSDGGSWYVNKLTPDDPELNENDNTDPEIFLALNYAFGNPICNKKLYPLDLQSSVCSGYGFATRRSSSGYFFEYVAKTYKPTLSPLSTDVFTLRVIQEV